jgi:vitamin B12 transporter
MSRHVQSRKLRLLGLGHGILASSAMLLPQAARGEQEAPSLSRVVIVSSRVPATVGQEAENLTVIKREQIDAMGAATGPDILRQVPGVQVDQLGGPGGISLAYIRGSDPNHVLVLVDGVRLNVPTNSRGGGVDLSGLDPNEIERIEVLRGAASSVYGADALGGVINVVTRKGEPGASVSAAGGGLGYRSLSARSTWQATPDSRLHASASALRDGYEADGGRLKLDQAALAWRTSVSAGSFLEFTMRHVERRSSAFPDDSGGVTYSEIRTLEQRESRVTTFGVRGVANIAAWTLNLEGTGLDHRENIASPGVAPGVRSVFGLPASRSDARFRRSGALFNAVRHIAGGSELAIGAEYQREHGTSATVYELFGTPVPADFDLLRRTGSAFAELKWLVASDLVLRAGLRRDSVQGNGSHWSPSVGARYSLPQLDGHFKASYSEGFKPPSFFALGLPPVLGGNPDLQAERSRGGSVGYEQRLGAASISAAVFRRRYTNLVTFENTSNRLVNAERVDVKGAELTLRVRVSDAASLQAHYTRLISHVTPGGEPLRQRPGRRAGVQLNFRPGPNTTVGWRLEYASEIFDSAIPTGDVFLPTYLRSDLTVTHAISEKARVGITVDNVADRSNQWYVGAPTIGRRARISARLSM